MIGKAITSIARPAARSSLLNGSVASQRLFTQSAMKAMSAKTNITTSKEAYQHSYQLTKALSASVNAALSSKAPAPRNTQLLKSGMPQLVPFFFVNEVVFGFAMISFLVYLNTKYILPRFVRMFMARLFMSKL